ncbi:hypothetical protein C900_00971 [Fulvivirga imtechensis AK7]|uniref:Uncharacterized protein n=2 Tax=Fulvivirga TaxID=396811 RepID=L8JZH0_9BACT|nr:hypothetical protein C900_00971 [Fulvivirga imtechensis AK7]
MIIPFHLSRTSARKMLHSFERELFYMMEKIKRLKSGSKE